MPQLAQVLREVVGERVVVVDQQDLHLKLGLRHLDGLQERARLVARLFVFGRRVRVGDDAGAGLTRATPSRIVIVRIAMQKSRLPAKSM